MTATTNGASLEDCISNIFSLIDLNGLRWKKFRHKENNNYLYTPIDSHPILSTYAKCIEENHIAAWRHEPQKRFASSSNGPGGSGGGGSGGGQGGGSGSHSNFPTPTRTSNNNTPTSAGPTSSGNQGNNSSNNTTTNTGSGHNSNNNGSSNSNYELWIFGYGNQLRVDNVIGEDLVEIEDETWEVKGLSYECRTLLFKALHNLIERNLITKGFTRIGRWFVQPMNDNINHTSSATFSSTLMNNSTTHNINNNNNPQNPFKQLRTSEQSSILSSSSSARASPGFNSLSTSISSTINRFIENRRDDSRFCHDKSDGLRHTSSRSSSTYFTSSLDGSKSSLSFAFSFFVHGDSTICAAIDVRQHPLVYPLTRADLDTFQEGGLVRVALAPHGLNGILNGVSYKDSDNNAATTTFIQQWSKFYPLPKTLARLVPGNRSPISAIANFNHRPPSSTNAPNQYNQSSDTNGSRSYLSNLTNMLLPPSQKPVLQFNHEPNEVPPIVEVIVAGHRMRYPSECVFTTSKFVDLYKTINTAPQGLRSSTLTSLKRPPSKTTSNKPNKLSLLSEKLSEDKQVETQVNIKSEPGDPKAQQQNFDGPFRLVSVDNTKSIPKTDDFNSLRQTNNAESMKDKTLNGCPDADGNNINPTNLMSNQTTISRFSSTKVGFNSNSTILGPTDLVKLFPTPPSLEQIVQSPSMNGEESAAKDVTVPSPAITNNDSAKDNGIDVYKPVECALMPPPPKWAALTNVVISSTKSLPPGCIYKGSSRTTSSSTSHKSNSTKASLFKSSTLNKQYNLSVNSESVSSPLADQTNKTGFTSIVGSVQPKIGLISGVSSDTILTAGTNFKPSQVGSSSSLTPTSTPSSLSSFTQAHQVLFKNLNEVNAIHLNLMMNDSVFGMSMDHNFESCTLCVCNMSIRGTNNDTILQKSIGSNSWRPNLTGNEPMSNSSSMITHEFNNECTCGFSATINRHCSHLSGLFIEDELELTNILYDPTEMIDQNKLFRKIRLSNYTETALNDEVRSISKSPTDSKLDKTPGDALSKPGIKTEKANRDDKSSQSSDIFEETRIFVIDQLKQQCSYMIHSNSSLSKVLHIESFRNNRHLTSCSNYYAQVQAKSGTSGSVFKCSDDVKYTNIRMFNKNPNSLKFSDFCELTKNMIFKLGSQSNSHPRLAASPVKSMSGTNIGSIFARMFGQNKTAIIGKTTDNNSRNNIFIQGLQTLVGPTLAIDPKGALQMLEQLVKDESKDALVTLNKAILIFSSPMHDWQFINASIPQNNFDVANLLKILQPMLDESIGNHNRLYKDFVHKQQQSLYSARDSPTGAPTLPTPPCQGPLTWRQFHLAAGRGTEDQCEPQPIPSLLVGHHIESHLALSPFALKFWDKLLLEPYAPGHNLHYLVITPDNQNIVNQVETFFKELSHTYELMKLGKHTPIGKGIVQVNANGDNDLEDDRWFSKLMADDIDPSHAIIPKLKAYAAKLNAVLAKTISDYMDERQPPYDPHADRFESSPSVQNMKPNLPKPTQQTVPERAFNQQLASGPSGLQHLQHQMQQSQQPHQHLEMSGSSSENQSSAESANPFKSVMNSSAHGTTEDNVNTEEEATKQSGIVIYIIDAFSSPSFSQNIRALTAISLLKSYSNLLEKLPESIKLITQLQLISLESIICHSRPINNISRNDQLKSLSMNLYSRCRKILTNQITAKSLTGFGPASALETFFKTKNPELCMTKMFTPPFILAPMKDKQTELGEMFGDRREKSSVLFCSYCITEDQRWLLASVTNDKGEMSETTVISINVLDRLKRPRTSVKRVALKKLMDFIVSVMSEWMNPWRLVVGKLGRVGHGELKEWATLMSKKSLLNYSRHLTDRCRQCSILPSAETVSILSACLVSLEPDAKLRIMPDQFTSDDRQASFNKCPLSTPEDASATHILVFPTSASIHTSNGGVEDPLVGSGLDDDLLNQFPLDDGIDDLGVEENMDDIFASAWDMPSNVPDPINSHHDNMLSSSNLQMGGSSVGDGQGNQDESLQLLQQPLALGYYISTAKIGLMPNWFWSTNPHLRNSCPVFLKSALHIHMPCVHLSDDLLHSGVGQSRKSHQLDSNLTTDVLRYVLEGYNSLSWLALNPKTYDRQSCLPVHMQNLLQLYHLMESFS